MKRLLFSLFWAAGALAVSAQSTFPLSVEVSAVTGVSVQGLTVTLKGEASGWVFDPVRLNAEGKARFAYVPAGTYTLSVDGSQLGLENYVDTDLLHEGEQTVTVVLKEAVRNPYALQAVVSHDDFTGEHSATVSWNRETDYFFDDFESYEPFAVRFDPWTGIDADREPAAEIYGSYPNRGTLQYATVFNALTIDPPVYYEYEVLRPFSGKQYVGFVRTRSGNANNDWLISPRIKVGVDNIVSFMAKASEMVPDRFAVCISTTGTEAKDFVQLTPGNYQTVDYKQWYEITYSLAQYEGQEVYIAIHCMSQNSFMFMVDDFYVGPKSVAKKARRVNRGSAGNPNERFVVSLDGSPVGETEEYSYTLPALSAGSHTVGVKALYLVAESDESTIPVEVPGADAYAALTVNLSSDTSDSLEGIAVNLLNVESARQTVLTAGADGSATVGFLPKGSYMVNVASDLFDEYNGSLELDGDMTLSIALTETVRDPFNVIYQTTENDGGSFDVEFWWNKDLGFRDSFEDYADFSQQFGEWTVYDLDKMPTYAFSIAGTIITKPETRGEVGAMIFNPDATEPVRASDDGLFLAPDGLKYVLFSSAEAAVSDDWMISPTVKIGKDYVLRFTAKSYDSMYPGSFEFCALRDGDIARPEYLDAFDLTADWLRYEVSLARFEGQSIEVAFHHITRDGWISFVDDIYIGPGEEVESDGAATDRCTFDVYLDGTFHSNVTEPYIKFTGIAEGSHTAGIQAVYLSGRKSGLTETQFSVKASGIEAVDGSEGATWRYFDVNGLEVQSPASRGIYIRTNGAKTEKVIL